MNKLIYQTIYCCLLIFLQACQNSHHNCDRICPPDAVSIGDAIENAIVWTQKNEGFCFSIHGKQEWLRQDSIYIYENKIVPLLGKDESCLFLCMWGYGNPIHCGALILKEATLFFICFEEKSDGLKESVYTVELSYDEENLLSFCIARLRATKFYEQIPILVSDVPEICYVFQLEQNTYQAGFNYYDGEYSDEDVFCLFAETGGKYFKDNLSMKVSSELFELTGRLLDKKVPNSVRPYFLRGLCDPSGGV